MRSALRSARWAWLGCLALVLDPCAAMAADAVSITVLDPTFGPMIARRPTGVILQRVHHPTADEMRLMTKVASVTRAADLGDGWRLARLDRFGRDADAELGKAFAVGNRLVLDLRGNRGGSVRRMLRVAGRFTGHVAGAVRLVRADSVEQLSIPAPKGRRIEGRVTVLVGPRTISSGEILAALLRRFGDATVLGERTWGKDYAMRVEPVDHDWRALVPDARIEVPGEQLAGGLEPDGPIPAALTTLLVAK